MQEPSCRMVCIDEYSLRVPSPSACLAEKPRYLHIATGGIMNRFLVFSAVLVLFHVSLTAQWVQTNGPYGGKVQCLTLNGDNLFAGTWGGGVFRSTDNGANWRAVNNGLGSMIVHAFACSPADSGMSEGKLYAGTSGGLFLSTDNAESWTKVNIGKWGSITVFAVAVSGTHIFVANTTGVYRSTNNGLAWSQVDSGLTTLDVQAFAVSDSHLFAGTYGGGVFRSTIDGVAWSQVKSGLTDFNVQALAVCDSDLFAGGYGVYRSTNNGTSWTAVDSGLTSNNVYALAVSGSNLFAGTNAGVYRSTNHGDSWTSIKNGLWDECVLSIAISTADTGSVSTSIFAGTRGAGVFLSTNEGVGWKRVSSGIRNTTILSLSARGSSLYAGTDLGGVFVSTNGGMDWSPFDSSSMLLQVYSLVVSGTNLFAGTYFDGLFISTDEGIGWAPVNNGLTSATICALAVHGANLFAGTWGRGVFLSTNNGGSWTPVNNGLSNSLVFSLAVSGANLYAGTSAGVFLSTNDGTSWTEVDSGLTDLNITALQTTGSIVFAGTHDGGAFCSSNAGRSWTAVDSDLTDRHIKALCLIGSNLFAGTLSYVFLSTNSGMSWNELTTNQADGVNEFCVVGPNIFIGTIYHGVWRRRLLEMINLPHLTAIPGNGQVLLTWGKDDNPEFMRYRIYGDTLPHPTTPIDSTTGEATDTTKVIQGLTNGTTYYFRLTTVDSAGLESGYSNEVAAIPDKFIFPITLGWNMVSVPCTVHDYCSSALFPFATSDAFCYEGKYDINDTLVNGRGYWLKLNGSQYVSMDGDPRAQDTINVRERWNMIGSISAPVAVAQITSDPGGLVTSQFLGYSSGYHISDTIQPGGAYWVKMNESGKLILASSGGAARASNRIRIVPTEEQPPAPPDDNEATSVIPKTYALDQNYPNPFNPTTTVSFAISHSSFVTLRVYDVLGREVATLLNGEQTAGYKSVRWNAANVPSGIYFYRITAGTFTQTKKLLLLK